MTDYTHDPPGYTPEPPISDEALAPLRVAGHEKYSLMRDRLGREPLEVIREMKHGGYRFKSKRGYPGVLVLRKGDPVPERMSFRQIAPILAGMSGVQVTYETVRRWWEVVFPDEPDEPDGSVEVEAPATVPVRRVARRRTPAVPVVGDEHADTIRAAMDRAKGTNPDVPPAAFVAPAE